MSHSLTLDGKEYIPAQVAGKRLGYTRDYILTLAREEKIDARKIGNKWYVHFPSVESFFRDAEKVREARRAEIRIERKAELQAHHTQSRRRHHERVLLETLAVLLVGLVVGTTGYLGNSYSLRAETVASEGSFLDRIAESLYAFFNPEEETSVSSSVSHEESAAPTTTTVGESVSEDVEELPKITPTSTGTSLVTGSSEVLTTSTISSIRDSFSDEVTVSVDSKNPDTGMIVPHFKDRDGETYRFLMVPVTREGG